MAHTSSTPILGANSSTTLVFEPVDPNRPVSAAYLDMLRHLGANPEVVLLAQGVRPRRWWHKLQFRRG